MNLGGPKEGDTATPSPAQDEADEVARAKVADANNAKPAGGVPSRPMTSKDAYAAFQKTRSPEGYKVYETLRAQESLDAERADIAKTREVQRRAAEHNLTVADYEFSQKKASQAAERATGLINNFDGVSDDVLASDPRYANQTKLQLDALQGVHKEVADGKRAEWNRKDNGYEVRYFDEKTGKLLSEDTINTVGDLRRATQVAGMMTNADNYNKFVSLNTATKIANEIEGFTRATAASQAATKNALAADGVRAVNATKEIAKAIQDPTGVAILENGDELRQQAMLAAIYAPEQIEYTKEVVKPDPNDPEKTTKVKTTGNRLLDIIEANAPRTSAKVAAPDGTAREMPITEAAQKAIAKYPDILREGGNSPEGAAAIIRQSLIGNGFDKRTVEWMIPQIQKAGSAQIMSKMITTATPAAAGVPVAPVAATGARGNLNQRPSKGVDFGPLLDNMQKRGFQPR